MYAARWPGLAVQCCVHVAALLCRSASIRGGGWFALLPARAWPAEIVHLGVAQTVETGDAHHHHGP